MADWCPPIDNPSIVNLQSSIRESSICILQSPIDDAFIPRELRRRPEGPRRYRADRAGARAAQEERRDVEGAVPVPRREDAVVPCERRQGVLPLLRGRRRRR